MNRVIKFRAFYGGKMLDLQKITPLALDEPTMPGLFIPFKEGCILMQFTGLKDRNGKEIYEGDLIAYDENSTRWLIEWQEAGFYAVRQDRNEVHVFSKGWFADAAIVIGNLYETPHLLHSEQNPDRSVATEDDKS